MIKQPTTELPNLTALRGVAALLIVVYHFDEIVLHLAFSTSSLFLFHSYLMVDLFFILSGFILYHVYASKFTKGIKWPSYFQFMKARFARVYPLHAIVLVLFIIIFYFSLNPFMSGTLVNMIHDPKALPTNFLLLQSFGLHKIFTWNLPSWSISAEWWSYLAFPFLVYSLSRQRKLALFCMLGSVIGVYVTIAYYLPHSQYILILPDSKSLNVSFDFGYLRGLAGFISGLIAYELSRFKSHTNFLASDAIGLIALTSCFLFMNTSTNDLIVIPFFVLLVLNFAYNKKAISKFCKLKALQFLGKISYSIYMVHYVLILCLALPGMKLLGFKYTGPGSIQPPLAQGLLIFTFFLSLVIFVSYLCYRWIEVPLRQRINAI